MGVGRPAVLGGGLDAWRAAGRPVETGPEAVDPADAGVRDDLTTTVAPDDLAAGRDAVTVLDVDHSGRFAEAHVAGARWVDRYDLEAALATVEGGVVLACRDGDRSGSAAAMLAAVGDRDDVRVLAGGVEAWAAAGHPVEDGAPAGEVRDAYDKPYYDGRAMRAYLEWEKGLGEAYARGEDPLEPST